MILANKHQMTVTKTIKISCALDRNAMDSIFEKQWFTSREWEVKNHILQFFAPLDPPTAAIVFSSRWWFSQMVGYVLPE